MADEVHDGAPEGERVQRVLARHGFGARRVCDDMVIAGRVQVNGETAVPGRRVDVDKDKISVDGHSIGVRPGLVHYLLNKPVGVITSASDPQGRPTVMGLVPDDPRVFSVGRLDLDTEGLLLLTNDGDLAHRLAHPSHGIDKEYLVDVEGELTRGELRRLRDGIDLDDGRTAPAIASQPQPGLIRLSIHEGRNRQVRRMCEALGYPVQRLVRVRIGPLADRDLAPGQWRPLEQDEIIALERATSSSTGDGDR